MEEKKKTVQEFAGSIKEKYPQYTDMDDLELTKKMLAKYPQYADVVDVKKKNFLHQIQRLLQSLLKRVVKVLILMRLSMAKSHLQKKILQLRKLPRS